MDHTETVTPAQEKAGHKVAVRAHGIVKSFGDGSSRLTVLKEVDFDARDGEIMMLVGPSGCGKTTLLSVLAGTLRAEQGSIEVFGHYIEKMTQAQVTRFRAENIGFIFQSFNLIPTLNCAENVSVPLLIQGMKPREAEAKARQMLEKVGLGTKCNNRPAQLSGGQQQRVAIARALVHEPRLVICDEPTAALDAKNGELVMNLFHEVARVPGRCVIIVTHDNRIFSFADRIAQMDDGRIIEVHDVENGRAPTFEHH